MVPIQIAAGPPRGHDLFFVHEFQSGRIGHTEGPQASIFTHQKAGCKEKYFGYMQYPRNYMQ
jgi:hypothetical protein